MDLVTAAAPRRPGLLRRAAAGLATPEAVVAFALPLAVTALLAWRGLVDGGAVLVSRSVRGWCLLTALSIVALTLRAAATRRLAAALAGLALAAVAGHAAYAVAVRLDAIVDAGEGEVEPPARILHAGVAAGRLPVLLAPALPVRRGEPVPLEVDGRRISAPVGREVAVGRGLTVRVKAVHAAPSFEVRRVAGPAEGAGIIKLVPGERDWFQVALLPHRLYAVLPAAPEGDAVLPPKLHLEVFRGKLRLLDEDVELGKRVEFEGLSLEFGEGARWARLEVRRRAPATLLWLAGALALGAAALAWRGRRARP